MASLSQDGRTGRRTLWINRGRKRKSVRLGAMSDRDASRFLDKVNDLESAQRLNQPIDPQLAGWVAGLPDDTHDRLARLDLVEPREPAESVPTLKAHCDRYIERRRPEIKPRSITLLEQTRGRLCDHFTEARPIDAITPDDAAEWRAAMLDKGASEATVRLHTRNAKALLSAAVDWELIDRNPFGKLRSRAIAANRDRYVSIEEAERVIDALPDARWRLLFALARFGGLRIPSESRADLGPDRLGPAPDDGLRAEGSQSRQDGRGSVPGGSDRPEALRGPESGVRGCRARIRASCGSEPEQPAPDDQSGGEACECEVVAALVPDAPPIV